MSKQRGLSRAIRDLTDPMIVMQRVVDEALALIPQAEGAVVELASGGLLTYVCTAGTMANHVGTRLRVEDSLSGLAVRSDKTLRCDDAASDSRVDRETCERVGVVSMICVPLRQAGEAVGVLKVSSSRSHVFGDIDVQTLTTLAEFISHEIAAALDISRIASNLLPPEMLGTDEPEGNSGVRAFVANVVRPGIVGDLTLRQRIEGVLDESAFTVVCQPIIDLKSGDLVGAEALARFPGPPQQPPDVWFDEAQRVGLGVDLELAVATAVLRLVDEMPQGAYLAVNIGPEAISTSEFQAMVEAGGRRIVVELTEHLQVEDYETLRKAFMALRSSGARLAIDDTGSGFAGLTHILKLAPDIIKLDRELTTGIDLDPVRRGLASALVQFAGETGAKVVAEGIETSSECETVRTLGIPYGQGYYLGRPGPLSALACFVPPDCTSVRT